MRYALEPYTVLIRRPLRQIQKEKGPNWTDPQKLDSLIRLARGIEFGIALGSIPLVFV